MAIRFLKVIIAIFHLQRYLTEFDFRYSACDITDAECRDLALQDIEGKRLTYRRTGTGTNLQA